MESIKKILVFFVLLSVSQFTYGQLSNFTLTINPTNETCLGNGILNMTTSGTQAGASISFAVYLLPDTSSPIAVLNTPNLTGLSAGEYRIIATQSLNGQSGTQQQDVEILNFIQALNYSVTPTPEICGNDGKLQINVISGVAISYEIINGPVIIPSQGSNLLTGLVAGQYQIRVFDICGDAVVQTFTLAPGSASLNIGNLTINDGSFVSCETLLIGNTIFASSGTVLAYPLNVSITVFSPTGNNVGEFSQIINSGAATSTTPFQSIPFYNDAYSYQITVTDFCGNTQTATKTVSINLDVSLSSSTIGCNNFKLSVTTNFYFSSYTIEFLSSPDGFNPSLFNLEHPGPFTEDSVVYESETNLIPPGTYVVRITDSCGRTADATVETEIFIPPPSVDVPCDYSSITINSSESNLMVSLILVQAPASYPISLPHDLTNSIFSGVYSTNENIFQGTYIYEVIDSCGEEHEVSVVINAYASTFNTSQRAGCDPGFGSIRVSTSSTLTSIILIDAPDLFPYDLPYDLTNNIITGFNGFNFGMLPAGLYTFQTKVDCGGKSTDEMNIIAYNETVNNLNIVENCGSFDLQFQHTSNGLLSQAFWLQKYDATNDVWVHPITNQVYDDGTPPNTTNSYPLTLNAFNLNINISGTFRIVKSFQSYNISGSLVVCTSILHEFTYTSVPQIVNVTTFGCADGSLDADVNAIGVPTLTYKITSKNGEPFLIDNAESSLFLGLEPGIYTFQVEDSCGNIVNAIIEISAVLPLSITSTVACDGQNGSLSVINYPFLNYEWFATTNPSTILSTSNQLLFTPYSQALQSGSYGVQISSPNSESCINQTLFFTLDIDNQPPNAGNDVAISQCSQTGTLDLFSLFTSPYEETGIWTDVSNSNALNESVLDLELLQAGTYIFEYSVVGTCDLIAQSTITLEILAIPSAPNIQSPATLCEGETLNLTTDLVENANYFWTGPNNFTSNAQNPIINAVSVDASGIYELYLEVNGCLSELQTTQVTVNPQPVFEISGDSFVCNLVEAEWVLIPANFSINQADVKWYFEDQIIASNTDFISVEFPGNYEVKVNWNGCEVASAFVVSEIVFEPELILDVRCVGDVMILSWENANEFLELDFQWSGPNGFSSTETSIDMTGKEIGEYILTISDESECVFSQTINVTRTICMIPKGVSPGTDDLNDTFDLSEYEVNLLKIYNRYGTLIYEKRNYLNEWVGQTNDGSLLPTATYFYYIEFADGSQRTGWVYLQKE